MSETKEAVNPIIESQLIKMNAGLPFWTELKKRTIMSAIETVHTDDVLREYMIADVVTSTDGFLIQWAKRHIPLTDEEIKTNYR